jgi:hypothetical protein
MKTQDADKQNVKNTTQHRKLKRLATQPPPKIGGESTCSQRVKLEDPEKTTDLSQVTDKLYHIMMYTSP